MTNTTNPDASKPRTDDGGEILDPEILERQRERREGPVNRPAPFPAPFCPPRQDAAVTTKTAIGWDRGVYAVERRCDCRKGNRSDECVSAGWHMVSSSDDVGDAMAERERLHDMTRVDHRIVDTRTGRAL